MPLSQKPLEQIGEEDLAALIQQGEAENKGIDYKQALPGPTDHDRRERLYDVSSFANASGGHLVFGIKAKDGVPTEVNCILSLTADAEKLRLHNMIQNGIQPRIPGVEIHVVSLRSGGSVLLVWIPRSWASPHMVTFQGASKFYSRNSAGKYSLDVSEIRSAFLLSESIGGRIREFRADRMAVVLGEETPKALRPGPKLALHVLPLQSFTPGFSIDLARVRGLSSSVGRPMHVYSGWDSQYTYDGVVFYENIGQSWCLTYTQVFRNGCIEVVDGVSLSGMEKQKLFVAETYEIEVVQYLRTLLVILKQMEIEPPFFAALSLLGVRGFGVYSDHGSRIYNPRCIDRDNLVIPAVLVDNFAADLPSVLKPLFDPVWNACGYAGSRNFDESGKWKTPTK